MIQINNKSRPIGHARHAPVQKKKVRLISLSHPLSNHVSQFAKRNKFVAKGKQDSSADDHDHGLGRASALRSGPCCQLSPHNVDPMSLFELRQAKKMTLARWEESQQMYQRLQEEQERQRKQGRAKTEEERRANEQKLIETVTSKLPAVGSSKLVEAGTSSVCSLCDRCVPQKTVCLSCSSCERIWCGKNDCLIVKHAVTLVSHHSTSAKRSGPLAQSDGYDFQPADGVVERVSWATALPTA